MDNSNGELESTLVGIALIVGAATFLYQGIMPWQPATLEIVIGLYLMLPKRMRNITESIKSFLRNGKAK